MALTQSAVNLATVPTFVSRWLIPRLPDLQACHPDIVVHMEVRTRPFLFADTVLDAALHASTAELVGNWAGTRAMALMSEDALPECSPRWIGPATELSPAAVAGLPLLQQSTRPCAWRQWFDAMGVSAPHALFGPRFELFSITATAAIHGLGVALVPCLLIEDELARGDLVAACNRTPHGKRSYDPVTPER